MQNEYFDFSGRQIFVIRSKKTGPIVRSITVRRSGQIDVVAQANISLDVIKEIIEEKWNLIKNCRGLVNLNNASSLSRINHDQLSTKSIDYPYGSYKLYKINPAKSSSINVYAYHQPKVYSPAFYDVKEVKNQKSATILFPFEWSDAKIKSWVYLSIDRISEMFKKGYGNTIIEHFLPEEIYTLIPDWSISLSFSSQSLISNNINKYSKTFTIVAPFGSTDKEIKSSLLKRLNSIKQELMSEEMIPNGIIGYARRGSNGFGFAVAPSSKSRSTSSTHNVSNDFWRGTGWVRDITETPSERASNVRNGKRIQRTSPISSQYTKASDLRGLGVIDASGRLTFIEKKNDAWIEDKNN